MPEDEDRYAWINRRNLVRAGLGASWSAAGILAYLGARFGPEEEPPATPGTPTDEPPNTERPPTDEPSTEPPGTDDGTPLDDDTPTDDNGDDPTDTPEDEPTEEPDPEPYIDNIRLYDLPRHWDTHDEIEIEGWVSGYDVDRIKLQERHEDSIKWRDLDEIDVDDDEYDTFYIDEDFEADEEGHVDFQIIAKAGDETRTDTGAIEFIEDVGDTDDDDDPEPYIDNVELYSLPRRWDVNDEIEIEGEVKGYDVDWIKLQERHEDSIRWRDIETKDIDDDDLDTFYIDTDNYEVDEEGLVEYQIIAKAGSERKSDSGAVEFFD